jgi:hypothetical protein
MTMYNCHDILVFCLYKSQAEKIYIRYIEKKQQLERIIYQGKVYTGLILK